MKKLTTGLVIALIGLIGATAGAAFANGRGSGESNETPCTLNYADVDLASRNMNWGVYCPDGGYISVYGAVFYDDYEGGSAIAMPDSGGRYVEPGETWTIWTQDNSRENYWGPADHGVLHISQTMCNGPGCQLVLEYIVEHRD